MNEPNNIGLIFEDKFVQIRISLLPILCILDCMFQIDGLLLAIFPLDCNFERIIFIVLFLSPQRLFSAIFVMLTISSSCWLGRHS